MTKVFWVERDPLGVRSVDALGMSTVADRLADQFLPDLTGATKRARYFSMLCWAREQVDGSDLTKNIQRWEVALSAGEARWHSDRDDKCSYLGSQYWSKGTFTPPKNPQTVYQTAGWLLYRGAMLRLGLLETRGRWGLTELGEELASTYRGAAKNSSVNRPMREAAMLCRLGRQRERNLLQRVIVTGTREVLQQRWGRRLRASGALHVLEAAHEERRKRHPLDAALAAAAVWTRLALGLEGVLLAGIHDPKAVSKALRAQIRYSSFFPGFDGDDEPALRARRLVKSALKMRDSLDNKEILDAPDLWNLAEHVDQGRSDSFEMLVRRHRNVKRDAAWVRPDGTRRHERRSIPALPSAATYRLQAFRSLLKDLSVR